MFKNKYFSLKDSFENVKKVFKDLFCKKNETQNGDLDDNSEDEKNKKKKIIIYSLVGLLLLNIFVYGYLGTEDTEIEYLGSLTYSEFVEELENDNIEGIIYPSSGFLFDVIYKEDRGLDVELEEGEELTIENGKRVETVAIGDSEVVFGLLENYPIKLSVDSAAFEALASVFLSMIPLLICMGFIMYIFRMQMGGMSAKKNTGVVSTVTFAEVAGMKEEKEELLFAIDSLKNAKEYIEKGVKPIKGILLEGPPGVGKTLLAKAIAGEAGVKFLSYSGSDFVEMYVGLGAKRIRKMYEEANKIKPCVIFIDEIDAVGKKRDSGNGNSESDHTLVALLEKMDGLQSESGILFIAATNRVDSLDNALLRPGRFDKTLYIGPPKTKEDRMEIIEVHLKGKTLEDSLTVEAISKECYGLTGAEIAAALNDAVLESFKDNRNGIISLNDIDTAVMKMYSKGVAKGKHTGKDRYRVAVHEVGHALMNKYVGRNVIKVSIQPYSSGVGGVTVIDGEQSGLYGLRTKSDLLNDIKVLYAGKVVEEILLGECSVGASNDLQRATTLLKDYVGSYCMDDNCRLALSSLAEQYPFMGVDKQLLESMNTVANKIYSEVYDYFIDEEVRKDIDTMAQELLDKEVIYLQGDD